MKTKNIFFVTLLVLSLISFVFAEEINFTQMECQSIIQYKDSIIGQELPEKVPVTNEILNIYISDESYGFIQIENKVVTDFGCEKKEKATYDLLIKDENTLFSFMESDDPMNTLIEKLNDREINLKGKKFSKKIKSGLAKFGLRIYSWFN